MSLYGARHTDLGEAPGALIQIQRPREGVFDAPAEPPEWPTRSLRDLRIQMSPQRNPEHPVDPLFLHRWSPRSFTGETIRHATLMTLFEAARWAPSAANRQPWRFLYGHIGTQSFGAILEGLAEFNQTWASKASALIVVLSRKTTVPADGSVPKPNAWHSFDTGAAWASLAFQAHLLGWAAHAMGGFDPVKLRSAMAIPEDVAIEAVVAVGKQSDKGSLPQALREREHPSERLPLERIVSQRSYDFPD